jgi:hypothetical protein
MLFFIHYFLVYFFRLLPDLEGDKGMLMMESSHGEGSWPVKYTGAI